MTDGETILFGIPVPSENKVFLAVIVVHIVLGLICTISGIVAMLSDKTKKTHPVAGKTYFWAMTLLFISIIVASVMRWPFNIHLLIVGTLAYACVFTGRLIIKKYRYKKTRQHTVLMGFSFVLLMTGFYVDNGKNLPFWNQFPQLFFWFFPSVIGIPVIIYVFFKLPLNKKFKQMKNGEH